MEETKIKITISSKATGLLNTIEEQKKDGVELKTIKNFQSTASISSFPTAKVEFNATVEHPNLIKTRSGDEVSVYVGEINKPLKKIHQGVLSSVTLKARKNDIEVIVESESAFYELEKIKVNSDNFKTKEGLREILSELTTICGIKEQISVDKDVRNEFKMTPFKNFPALCFINLICLKYDLVYDFGCGDVMTIKNRKDVVHKMLHSIPIITLDNDSIISSEFKQ